MPEVKNDESHNNEILGSSSVPVETNCKFEKILTHPFKIWKCSHPEEIDGLCIFHMHKPSIDERLNLTPVDLKAVEEIDTRCRKAFVDLFKQIEQNNSIKEYEFIGFVIPPNSALAITDSPSTAMRKLNKPLNFHSARFTGDFGLMLLEIPNANFRAVEFCGNLIFANIDFDGISLFHDTVFHGIVNFSSVKFLAETYFVNANFKKGCEFSDCNFANFTNFDRAFFGKRSSFIGYGGKQVFEGLTLFCELSFSNNTRLSLINVSLAKADFYDTDLEFIRFVGVKWNSLKGRPCIWGEVRVLKIDNDPIARKKNGIHDWDKPPQLEKIAEKYAQLVTNYEQRRDIDNAEAFHIGEMEIRRIKLASHIDQPWLRKIRENCNSFSIYRILSLYGTSYVQATTALISVVLILSLLFMVTGIEPTIYGKHLCTRQKISI
ncbi:MAG: pentapeptide repeat-containing protein [Methylococcaceae bacterium]